MGLLPIPAPKLTQGASRAGFWRAAKVRRQARLRVIPLGTPDPNQGRVGWRLERVLHLVSPLLDPSRGCLDCCSSFGQLQSSQNYGFSLVLQGDLHRSHILRWFQHGCSRRAWPFRWPCWLVCSGPFTSPP